MARFYQGRTYDFRDLAESLRAGDEVEVEFSDGSRFIGTPHRISRESGTRPVTQFILELVGAKGDASVYLKAN